MQVTINEQQIREDFSHMRSLEEALVELNDRFVPPGQQLFQVRVNGEFFSERYPRESKYMDLKEISTLDLKTIPDKDMARVILGEAVDQAEILCQALEKSSRLFRVSAEDEANHYFAQVIEALRWLLMTGESACQVLEVDLGKAVARHAGQPSSFFQSLQDLLAEMVEISEHEDYILLADLLEYELLPTVREWQHILRNLSNS
jgi:hypothetical protein|uniref:Uncharacterized protein n=1 Tax=Desulfobacca acetoxidans TaxID=60893 RepID=A0A7V6DPP6_9BACT